MDQFFFEKKQNILVHQYVHACGLTAIELFEN